MTEEEAKTKWCPMLRKGPLGTARNAPEDVPNLCIGSACMAWRATDNVASRETLAGLGPVYVPAGYCGLAGKP